MNSLAVTAEQVEQARVLADRARQGDRRAVARCITLIENQHPLSYEVVKHLYPHTGNAYRVGVTGPPGVGKSSLISSLITTCREEDRLLESSPLILQVPSRRVPCWETVSAWRITSWTQRSSFVPWVPGATWVGLRRPHSRRLWCWMRPERT